MTLARLLVVASATIALAACTSAQEQRQRQQSRAATVFLERQGSIGDPGRVAAADFAFARMAREEGTWTAFREYAAPDAVMDAPGGYAPARDVLRGRADPAEPIRWAPTDVWSSCDGRLAVSMGRFLRPNGVVGDYITIWELQSDNSYKWIYDTGTPDDPQPAPQPVDEDAPEDAIVVPGMRALQGRVADCPREGEAFPEIPISIMSGAESDGQDAPDKSLRWNRYFMQDGRRLVTVEWVREGTAQQATSLSIAAE